MTTEEYKQKALKAVQAEHPGGKTFQITSTTTDFLDGALVHVQFDDPSGRTATNYVYVTEDDADVMPDVQTDRGVSSTAAAHCIRTPYLARDPPSWWRSCHHCSPHHSHDVLYGLQRHFKLSRAFACRIDDNPRILLWHESEKMKKSRNEAVE
jgi:hypothetical protein